MLGSKYTMEQVFQKIKSEHNITDTDTYVTVTTNQIRFDEITDTFASELSEDISTSVFGLGIVSDFNLYHNMETVARFYWFLNFSKIELDSKTELSLLTNRIKIRTFVQNRCNKILLAMFKGK